MATAVITVVMASAAATIGLGGSAVRSQLRPADADQPVYSPSSTPPTSLRALWAHPSAGTGTPLVTRGNLVTVAPDGTLEGRDAGTGEQRWSYTHPGGLCAAAFFSDRVVAAYHGPAGCSDVTAVDPTAQRYSATRQSAAPDRISLIATGRHVLSLGPERVEIWRDDLARTVEYGAVAAPQEPGSQPRTGCTMVSAGLDDESFAVSETCPGETSVRLTLSETVPQDSRRPEELFSGPTGADGLWVVDVADDGVLALVRRGERWSVDRFDSPTASTAVITLPAAPGLLPGPDTLSGDGGLIRWFDGRDTHAFDAQDGSPRWTVRGTSGPGLGLGTGGEGSTSTSTVTLVPVAEGFATVSTSDGRELSRVRVAGERGPGITGLAQVGDILYERRADGIHAYKMNG